MWNDSSFKVPKVNHLVEESHEHPWIGARSNRGFQDEVEEVSETDDESDGSEGAPPSLGRSKVIVGGWPTFVRFLSNRLAAPMALVCFCCWGRSEVSLGRRCQIPVLTPGGLIC